MNWYGPRHMGGYYYNPLPQIANFFQEKQATSEAAAVAMNSLDWQAIGLTSEPLSTYSFIKVTADSKYWINLQELDAYSKKQSDFYKKIRTMFKVFISIGLVMFVIALIFIVSTMISMNNATSSFGNLFSR